VYLKRIREIKVSRFLVLVVLMASLIVYIIFLFNLATSVYIMRLVDQNKLEQAGKFNGQAAKILAVITVVMVVAQAFL
jgi:hypothetical protein